MIPRRHGRALAVVFAAWLLYGCATPPQTRQLLLSNPDLPPAVELVTAPFYPQRDYQCGPAALATVINFHHLETSADELVSRVYVPKLQGSLQAEMLAATTSYRRLAVQLDGRLQSVLREVAAGLPVLVLQNLGLDAYPVWHYAVVIGYDLEQEEVILRSGEIERLVRPLAVFERTWARAGHWSMVAVPPDIMPASAGLQQYRTAVLAFESSASPAARLQAYSSGLRRWPDSFVLSMGAGNAHYQLGRYAASERAFRRAIAAEPARAEAWNNLGYALWRQGRRQQALQAIARALQLAPGEPEYLDSLREISATRD